MVLDGGAFWTYSGDQFPWSDLEGVLSIWVPPAEQFFAAGTVNDINTGLYVCTLGSSGQCGITRFDNAPVEDVVGVDPFLYVATGFVGVWKGGPFADDWIQVLGDFYGKSLFAQGDAIYAGGDALAISLDDGATWTFYDTEEGLADAGVYGIYLEENTLYAATADPVSGGLSFAYCEFCSS